MREKNKIRSFRDLDVWKKSMEIVERVYPFAALLPKEEQFGLISQMRRAAISLPSNIAEGFRRRNNKEFKQFLHIVLGSCAELETQVELCGKLYKADEKEASVIIAMLDHLQAMTMSLIKNLRS